MLRRPRASEDRPAVRSLIERFLMRLGWTAPGLERRLALRALTDAQLEDIGLSRAEIDGRLHRCAELDRRDARPWR